MDRSGLYSREVCKTKVNLRKLSEDGHTFFNGIISGKPDPKHISNLLGNQIAAPFKTFDKIVNGIAGNHLVNKDILSRTELQKIEVYLKEHLQTDGNLQHAIYKVMGKHENKTALIKHFNT